MGRSAWQGIMRPFRILWAKLCNQAYYDEVSDRVYCGRDIWIAEAWLVLHCPQALEDDDENDKELAEV